MLKRFLKWLEAKRKEMEEEVIRLSRAKVIKGDNGRDYIECPDGLRLIFDNDRYVGFYTQEPPV